VAKSKNVRTGCNPVGLSEEGCRTKSYVLPFIMMMMMVVVVVVVFVILMTINVAVFMRLETTCVYNDYVVCRATEEETEFWEVLQLTCPHRARSYDLHASIMYTENAYDVTEGNGVGTECVKQRSELNKENTRI
jgi:hypothetical protein